ncbi:MAG: asparaginase domain-containing protein, partial [Candidatus Woesearchaeota archaeon]
FVAETDYSGVGVCMHETTNDNSCLIHRGVKVRKMHSSRRDAFKSINSLPIARVTKEKIEFIDKNYEKKDKTKKIELKNKFEKNIALVKIHPGQDDKEFKFYVTKFKGVVFEGTGLGHLPVTKLDVHTKHHKKILSILEKATIPMFMTSQTINGRVDMDVYSTGRDLQKAGVVGAEDMNSECAFVKLGWVLAQTQDKEQVKKMMLTNYCGEITECSKPNDNY